jgi:hypothetical protein
MNSILSKSQVPAFVTPVLLAIFAICLKASAQTSDPALNALVKKGILTVKEAQDAWSEAHSNLVSSATSHVSKWKINKAIKEIELFGDARVRYEYRGADNVPGSGASGETYERERFRYSLRAGIRGELFDQFNYGLRIETSTNPRSPWVTFGDDSNPTPFAKNSDGISVGQIYLGWHPLSWCEITVGKMPMPLYVTPLLWDADLNPEGAFEKFKTSLGSVDLFAQFGQFLYQDTNPDYGLISSDTFLLAWQVGATVNLATNLTFKIAPVVYSYTGVGNGGGLNKTYTGEGFLGLNTNTAAAYNQNGINDLLILETPAELYLKLGAHGLRLFGDFAYNFQGDSRAEAAAATANLPRAYTDQNKAYQVGIGFGNLGLVYGQTAKKNTWEVRTYWQHVEQYAADVNLLDSDFFEGRANLEGVYAALAYSFTDAIIGTFRYGYARRINENLGTGGSNLDLPVLNPILNYQLLQFDLTLRF